MKNAILVILTTLILVGCGSRVEVPPAHVGKILTKNGYAPETLSPSKFRLQPCFAYCDKLTLLEVSDAKLYEKLVVFMPNDKLNLAVDVRGTFSIPSDPVTIDALFDRVPAAETQSDSVSKIDANKVYATYGQQAIRGIVRSEITKYTIQDVLENRQSIAQNIHQAIVEKLKVTKTPLHISRFELAGIQPPKVIVEAQQAAKEREIDIQKAEADAQVELVKAERDLEVAKKNRLVEREKAEAIAEQNRIAAASITPEVLAYKKLETTAEIFKNASQGGNLIVIPADINGVQIAEPAVLAKLLGRELKK